MSAPTSTPDCSSGERLELYDDSRRPSKVPDLLWVCGGRIHFPYALRSLNVFAPNERTYEAPSMGSVAMSPSPLTPVFLSTRRPPLMNMASWNPAFTCAISPVLVR